MSIRSSKKNLLANFNFIEDLISYEVHHKNKRFKNLREKYLKIEDFKIVNVKK